MGQRPRSPPPPAFSLHASPGEATEEGRGKPGTRKRGARTDLQLPLDPVLAAVPVLGLGRVIFGHDLHELPGECGVLGEGHRHIRRPGQGCSGKEMLSGPVALL